MKFITLEDYILEFAPVGITEETLTKITKGVATGLASAVKRAIKAGRELQVGKGGEKGFFFTRGGKKVFAAVKGKIAGAKESFKGRAGKFKEAQAASKKARGAKKGGITEDAAKARARRLKDQTPAEAKRFEERLDALADTLGSRRSRARREGAKIAVTGGGAVAAFTAVALRRAKRRKEKAAAARGGRALRPLSAAARKKRRLRPGQTDVSR